VKRSGLFVGAATLDLHYLLEAMPEPDSKGPAAEFGLYSGGPAANAAVTFAHLGGTPTLITEVGSHPIGGLIKAELAERGVAVRDLIDGAPVVPMVSAIVSTGERRMVVASRYPDEAVSGGYEGGLPEGTRVVLVDGFLGSAAVAAAGAAADRGVPVVLDAGSWKPALERILPRIDFAICSADFRPPGVVTAEGVFDDLARRGVRRIAITRGGDPIRYCDGDRYGELAVEDTEVVDTLGAGDVLHGAFCHALAGGAGFVAALEAAARIATQSVGSFGTRAWMDAPREC
jgi:sugar/nucleoside kinase (ribokinase family)